MKVNLGNIVNYEKGKKPKLLSSNYSKEVSLPYINIKAFEKGLFDEYTNGEKCTLCDEGDLLMVWDGARAGYTGKAKAGAVGSTLMKIEPKDGLNKEYLFYFLQSLYRKLNTNPRGVGIPHVEPSLLWNAELPLPPLPIQQAIVARLEALFSELDKGIEQLKAARQQLRTYRQAVLKAAFEGRLTGEEVKEGELPEGWKWKALSEIAEVSGGITKNAKREQLQLKVAFLRVANVYFNELVLDDIHTIGVKENELERSLLKKGDLLFVEGNGSLDQIGRVAVWNGMIDTCVHQNHLIKTRFKNDTCMPMLALHYFCSKEGRDNIKEQASSTSGLHTLSISKVAALKLPLPPFEKQAAIISEIESRLSVADKLEETIAQGLQQAEALRQRILKKAFEGKLSESG